MGNFDNNPNLIEEIKSSSFEELKELAQQLRTDIIKYVSENGGHLASNLGIVELTIALHRVFDSPKDKIIFDVGHQTYVHKMITGRYEEMSSLRKIDGLSGFPKRNESIHDMYDSGHSGTSISACLGYAKARDIKHEDYSCIAVIGDGAMTGGVAWEAINTAGSSKTPMIVVLNDNKMSISENVGGFAKHLHRLRTSKAYNDLKLRVKSRSSAKTQSRLEKLRNKIKYSLLPHTIFEELGFKYYGPIDGHNIEELCKALEFAKGLKRPVCIHVITKKGKGFAPAESNPSKYHGIGSFNPETADEISSVDMNSWSWIFGDELSRLAEKDEKIVAVTAAMADGTGLTDFEKNFPDRFFDVGIAEQNAVSFCAGLALNGLRPVFAVYSTFLQRAYDMVITEVCLQKLPVIFGVDRAGITGGDGETHQGEFDIAYFKSMPNITVLSPRDEESLRRMLDYAVTLNGPVAIRYPRGRVPQLNYSLPESENFDFSFQLIRNGSRVIILSDGASISDAAAASELLESKWIKPAVCNIMTLKPLSIKLLYVIKNYDLVVTIEDGCVLGGFGETISRLASENNLGCRVLNIGWPDKFIEHGNKEELKVRYGLDAQSIAKKIGAFF